MPSSSVIDGSDEETWPGIGRLEAIKLWFLFELNRWLLTGILAGIVFGVLVGISTITPSPLRQVLTTSDATNAVFTSMLVAIITAVSLVVTFNQLVLSQELGALGDQRQRMQEAMNFREDVTPWLSTPVGPPDPATFMAALLASVGRAAERIDPADIESDTDVQQQVRSYVDTVSSSASTVEATLLDSQFGTFEVISALLKFDYSWDLFEANRLLAVHRDEFSESTVEALEDLTNLYEFIGPAREHFKTLYFQWELVNLSRAMLYMSIPALLVALGMVVYVDPGAITGTTLGVDNLVWLVCFAITGTLTPFLILISFVLRIATVAKRTLAIGAFVLRDTDDSSDFSIE